MGKKYCCAFLLFLVFILQACGSWFDSKDKKKSNTPQATGQGPSVDFESGSDQVTVRILPFRKNLAAQSDASESVNLAWIAPRGKKLGEVLRLAPPATAEGFHWKWELRAALDTFSAEVRSAPSAKTLQWVSHGKKTSAQLSESPLKETLLNSAAIGFQIDFNRPPESGQWPAVVGLGNGKALALSLLALSPVVPLDLGAPLRLEVDVQGLIDLGFSSAEVSKIVLNSQAPRCGQLCLAFGNFVEAVDTPFVLALGAKNLFTAEKTTSFGRLQLNAFLADAPPANPSGAPSQVEVEPLEGSDGSHVILAPELENCRAAWLGVLEQGALIWNHVHSKWGQPEATKERYDIYLMQPKFGASYQGLEHSASTLLMFGGDCNAASFSTRVGALLAHEMIHVWNVRHVFPTEHAQLSAESFDERRITQLYFYEGFTEGYARVARAETSAGAPAAPSSDAVLAPWNDSLAALYRSFASTDESLPFRLDQAPSGNAFGQYATGSGFLLFIAMKLRLLKSAAGLGAAEAAQDLWKIFDKLRMRVDSQKASTSLALPPWKRRAWNGLNSSIASEFGQGYTSLDVFEVLRELVGPIEGTTRDAGDPQNLTKVQVGLTKREFVQTLQSFATLTGMKLQNNASGQQVFAPDSKLTWPFAPPTE